MSAYKKNIMVGVTVLAALFILGWMILRFSTAPVDWLKTPQMPIHLTAITADGISEGSPILFRGVAVGRVTKIGFSSDRKFALMECAVDTRPPLPANLEGRIRSQLLGGGSAISLVLVHRNPDGTSTDTDTPEGELSAGAEITAVFVGIDFLPPEFKGLGAELKQAAEEFRLATSQIREAKVIPKLADAIDSLKKDIDKAGKLIDSAQDIVGDESLRKDLRQSLANFRAASESATRIGDDLDKFAKSADKRMNQLADNGDKMLTTTQAHIDDLSKQVGDRLTQIATILANLEKTTRNINEGKGTAARLLNDPALYENLLDTSKDLNLTILDLKRLIEQWEQEGVPLKLK